MRRLLITSLFTLTSSLFAVNLSPLNTNNSLIVYNSNIGLVHEQRKLNLSKNDAQIVYEDVASTINTDSVNVTLPKSLILYSQQYRYDKLTQNKLLDAHIAKDVRVKVKKNSKEFETITAQLLSNDGLTSIVKHKDKVISVESKNIIFERIPSELITKPSLVWNIQTDQNINGDMSIDYLIKQISWKSDYILNVDENEANLIGWITIDNRSGKAFKNTDLHLLAGDINRAQPPMRQYDRMVKTMALAASPEATHQAHEGYHFYSIPFKVNLANNEKTQVKFLTQEDIAIERKYTARMANPNYLSGEAKRDVTQHITIDKLDSPLPKGVVRTYSSLAQTKILLGESRIKHTPKNTPIPLKIGKNFDIKVTETLIKRKKSSWHIDEDVKYSIKNSSDEAKNVELQIPFNRNEGSSVESDEKYTFTKGNIVTFKISVKANKTKEFTTYYRVKKHK